MPIKLPEPEEEVPPHLGPMLSFSVPLWARRYIDNGYTHEQVIADAEKCAEILAHEAGAHLQTRVKAKSEKKLDNAFVAGTADAFNALARGLAALSFAPGGVSFCGGHWESHPEALRGWKPPDRDDAQLAHLQEELSWLWQQRAELVARLKHLNDSRYAEAFVALHADRVAKYRGKGKP